MSEKLPAPCEACRGTGMRRGSVCGECEGKGYRLFVNGNQIPVRQENPQRRQRRGPAQHPRHPVR
jgi:DnaJ-class molecular chaperone